MLMFIALALVVLWLIGFVGFHVVGAFIHILIVLAIIFFVVGLLSGRKTV